MLCDPVWRSRDGLWVCGTEPWYVCNVARSSLMPEIWRQEFRIYIFTTTGSKGNGLGKGAIQERMKCL